MSHTSSQTFLRELDEKLWTAADKLRSNLAAAVYKHAVLGLIFLKYVSDSFAQRQAEIAVGVPPFGSASLTGLAGRQIEEQIRDPDSNFHLSPADYGTFAKYEEAIDVALEAVEKENPKLKNVLNKDYVRLQIPQENLAGLIDLIATIPFQHADLATSNAEFRMWN